MKQPLKALLSSTCVGAALCALAVSSAYANPMDGTVVGGAATISASGSTLNVHQSTDRAVIDWRGFDIGAGETTAFHQPNAGSVAINRVTQGGASRIDGNLTANGNLVIINQNGVMFGAGAKVDVNGLVASTADIDTASAMAGGLLQFNHAGNNSNATISNAGTITAREAGLVGFVAPNVINSGVITARLGKVQLASGDTATVDLYGDGLMSLAVSDAVTSQLVSNAGTIAADGGTIALTAAAGSQIVNSLITNTGTLQAQSVGSKNGDITVTSQNNTGMIDHTGMIDVLGPNGGTVAISGHNVAHQGTIRADGYAGKGGKITIEARKSYIDSSQAITSAHGVAATVDGQTAAAQGGDITVTAGEQLFSSGNFDAGAHAPAALVPLIAASAASPAVQGGSITLTSNGGAVLLYGVHVYANASIIGASPIPEALAQGGTIKIGGGAAGQDATVCNASDTRVNFSSVITADAIVAGNGGKVTFWGTEFLGFAGTASARGGSASGNGGTIELSSGDHQPFISTAATINASAPNGIAGTLIYDPKNITIATGGMTSGLSAFELVDPNAADVANHTFGSSVTALSSGNIVVAVSNDDFAASGAGAVYLFNGAAGALISTLRGGQASDGVGTGVTALTGNENYVIRSTSWANGTVTGAGAVTWGSGTVGISGTVSSTNSLVGSTASDAVGTGVTALTNGNYVVNSTSWDNGTLNSAGAATWGSGTAGIVGVISSTNSLVGSTASDAVGAGVTALTNGNYVVRSSSWDNGTLNSAGAATWGSGTAGIVGVISSTNSLVGSTALDQVSSTGVTALTNGNYVVRSSSWDNGTLNAAGAATWGSGTAGIVGAISSTNSLVGSTALDQVSNTGLTALTNGNYVVRSATWDNGALNSAGAATWGSGTAGIAGVISSTNSLVGSAANDTVSNSNVIALTNGNYVVGSQSWNGVGAGTWGSGTGGTVGAISSTNSLIGSTASDQVSNGLTALTNGNYVVNSTVWDNGTINNAGAVTWGSGTGGTVGVVSSTNSLVGSTTSDMSSTSVTALTNGNYVASYMQWDNGTITNAGAATWGSGTGGTVGVISSTNSLIGSVASDQVGSSVTALTNGNYVVNSQGWDNGTLANVGAATWASGTVGVTGVISSTNSLIGSTGGDGVGGGITALTNGNYVLTTIFWDNDTVGNAGAVTWSSGTAGIVGVVSSSNSIVGTSASAGLGSSIEDTVNGTFIARFSTAGRVYVSSASGNTLAAYDGFSDLPTMSITLDPTFITTTLNAGTAMTLQANNDITVTNDITVNNGSGDGGALTLQAGRSIFLNANITTDDGNLFLYANEKASAGVVNAYRDSGAAVITMGSGTNINAGTGTVTIRLDDGAGNTNSATGAVTLYDIMAGVLSVETNGADSDIILAGAYTATGTGGATFSAYRNINLDAAITLSGGDLLLRSDNADNDEGLIFIGANISTNGGDITMGGGSGAISAGTGYAVGGSNVWTTVGGSNGYGIGVYSGMTINAGTGGNIIMNGRGYTDAGDNNYGVYIVESVLQTAGTGSITLSGIGGDGSGASSSDNYGIRLESASLSAADSGGITLTGGGGGGSATNSSNNYGVLIGGTGTLTTVNGALMITGTGGGAGTGQNSYGVYIADTGTAIQATGTGALSITGIGGVGDGGSNNGFYMTDGNVAAASGALMITGTGGVGGFGDVGIRVLGGTVTTTSGAITITGTGGADVGGSDFGDDGVDLYDTITSTSGAISITGVGGATDESFGTYIQATISTSNTITITGTGGSDDYLNTGVYIDTGSTITGGGGAISITGTGGNGAGRSNADDLWSNSYLAGGVVVRDSDISNSGTGTIAITGVTYTHTDSSDNVGVLVDTGATITTANGALSVTGTGGGGGTGTANYGVYVTDANSTIKTTGTGSLSVTGLSGNASGSGGTSYGVYVNAANGIQATSTGSVTVSGTGGNGTGADNYGTYVTGSITGAGGTMSVTGRGGASTGDTNYGVYITGSGAAISNTGTGTLTVSGTGGGITNSATNYGVYVAGSGGLTTADGLLAVNGTGGGAGAGGNNYGVNVSDTSSTIRTTGTGALTIVSQGGNSSGTGNANPGLRVALGGVVSTVNGALTITSTGGGAGTSGSNQGVVVNGANSAIKTTGTGALSITGLGGNGSGNGNQGVRVVADGVVSTVNGTLTVTGTGGGTGTSTANHGVYVAATIGTSAAITTSGTGALSVTGTGGNSGGSGGTNYGVYSAVADGIATTSGGSITVTGVKGGQADSYGIGTDAANGIRTSGTAGNITLLSDTLLISASDGVNAIGSLTVAPRTTGTMALGTTGSALNVDDTTLGNLTAASYIFGSTTAGDVTITTARDFVDKNVTFISGSNIILAGALTKGSGSGTAVYNLRAYGNITNTGGAGVTASAGKITLTFDADYDNNASGSTTLTGATLTSNGGNITFNHTAAFSGTNVVNAGTGTITTGSTLNGGAGSLTLTADDMVFGGNFSGTGTLLIKPSTLATAINLNGVAGGLNLSSVELGYINNGVWSGITFGQSTGAALLLLGTSSWDSPLNLLNGTGRITLSGTLAFNGQPLFARNFSTGDIKIAAGATITSSASGNAITLASGSNFTSVTGISINLTGGGRWLVYSANPASNSLNGLTGSFNRYSCSYSTPGACAGGTISIPASGNGFAYSYTPTLTVTPTAQSVTYGDGATLVSYGYGITGYLAGEGADTITGSLAGTSDYDVGDDTGSYYLNHSSGALASTLGYGFTYANNATAITITKKSLTVSAANQTIDSNTAVPATTISYSGFITGDSAVSLTAAPTASSLLTGLVAAGTYNGNYVVGGGVATNYSFTYVNGNLIVTTASGGNGSTIPNTVVKNSQDAGLTIPTIFDSIIWLSPSSDNLQSGFTTWYLPTSSESDLLSTIPASSYTLAIDPELMQKLGL